MPTYQLRGGFTTHDRRLDRLPPPDWEHYEKFPLTAARLAATGPGPGAFSINWYSNYDSPVLKGSTYWIGLTPNSLGSLRGGHCIAMKQYGIVDTTGWWEFYDQGQEGACVGFGTSRVMTLLNRKRYLPRGNYWQAQRIDEWAGGAYPGADPFYEGTSTRAGFEVLRTRGDTPAKAGELSSSDRWAPVASEGITAYRWAGTWDEVRKALGLPDSVAGVPLLNSWGRSGYPHVVRITDECGAKMLAEDGEAGFVTDK
jgi:hypothetical protein